MDWTSMRMKILRKNGESGNSAEQCFPILMIRVINMERGLIIFLNGTSSSGKTSIAMEMKNQGDIPFHHLSVDQFLQNYDQFIDQYISRYETNKRSGAPCDGGYPVRPDQFDVLCNH